MLVRNSFTAVFFTLRRIPEPSKSNENQIEKGGYINSLVQRHVPCVKQLDTRRGGISDRFSIYVKIDVMLFT